MATDEGLFENVGDDKEPTRNITPIDNSKNYLEDLVGEGKKFKTNEDLARGKFEADQYIPRLEGEMDELRTELRSRQSLQEVLAEIKAANASPDGTNVSNKPNEPNADQENLNNNNPTLSTDELNALVERKIQEQTEVSSQKQNLNTVKSHLIEAWGPQFGTQLAQVATQLGVERLFLDNLAATSPSAFMKLVGIGVGADTPNPLPASSSSNERQQLNRDQNSGSKRFKDYEALRRSDPEKYFSVPIQQEIFKQATEQGDAFYL